MHLQSRFHVYAFLLAAALPLSAQDDIPPAGRGGDIYAERQPVSAGRRR